MLVFDNFPQQVTVVVLHSWANRIGSGTPARVLVAGGNFQNFMAASLELLCNLRAQSCLIEKQQPASARRGSRHLGWRLPPNALMEPLVALRRRRGSRRSLCLLAWKSLASRFDPVPLPFKGIGWKRNPPR